jgi:hypothetical protein
MPAATVTFEHLMTFSVVAARRCFVASCVEDLLDGYPRPTLAGIRAVSLLLTGRRRRLRLDLWTSVCSDPFGSTAEGRSSRAIGWR